MEYVPFDANVKVLGGVLLAMIDGLGAFKSKAEELLKADGIDTVDPEGWYSQKVYLDILKTIGLESVLKQVGSKIPENAKFPPEIDSPDTALAAVDVAYKMNHKDGEIGYYKFTSTGDNTGEMECKNPYPCAFDEGIIVGVARKFAKTGSFINVKHKEGDCRKSGAEKCTYEIKW